MNHHFTADELAGKPQPDQHWHEHATCFRLGDRGLFVITSCRHLAGKEMPEKLVLCGTGSSFTFTA